MCVWTTSCTDPAKIVVLRRQDPLKRPCRPRILCTKCTKISDKKSCPKILRRTCEDFLSRGLVEGSPAARLRHHSLFYAHAFLLVQFYFSGQQNSQATDDRHGSCGQPVCVMFGLLSSASVSTLGGLMVRVPQAFTHIHSHKVRGQL